MYKAAIITASDRGAAGDREDQSGQVIEKFLQQMQQFEFLERRILPDDLTVLAENLRELAEKANLILTTGGTGFSPRDNTPEATLQVAERLVPGIPEAIRLKSLAITDRAMLSRAAAAIRGQCLIINLPGSVKAVRESLEVIRPVLPHALEILTGQSGECGIDSADMGKITKEENIDKLSK